MKVKNVLMMSLLASSMMLAACGGGSKGGDSSQQGQSSGQQSETSQTSQSDYDPPVPTGEYDIKLWGSEIKGVKELFEQQVDAFEEDHPGTTINLTYENLSEAEAKSQVLKDLDEAADLYCFAQDQFADLVQGQALAYLGTKMAEAVAANNDAGSVAAATSGDKIYAYPMTADNGYFMYYNKSIIPQDIVGDMEAIVARCEATNTNFAMETNTSAWYLASFFFGSGCHSTWETDTTGKFVSYDDNFNSEKGLVAMRGMQHLVKSSRYVSASVASEFEAAIPASVLVSGTWVYQDVAAMLGSNLGVAALPSFKVDGKSYHLGSYSGFKLMGVKPQADAQRAAVCAALAYYLTGEKCQLERFNAVAWGPSNVEAAQDPAVQANPALAALLAQSPYSKPQGAIPGAWWDFAKVLGSAAADATLDDTEALQAALNVYTDSMNEVTNPTELAKWALVGQVNGGDWTAATATYMTEKTAGVWEVEVEIHANEEFKVCPVKENAGTVDWDSEVNSTHTTVAEGLEEMFDLPDVKSNIKCLEDNIYHLTLTEAGEHPTLFIELAAA